MVGIETDRGPWVQALIAAGYRVYAINPLQAARYRERPQPVGRQERSRLMRTRWPTWSAPTLISCGRWPATVTLAEAIKVVARAHKTLIWERTRHMQRLRARAAGVLPRRAGRVRRPDRPGGAGTAGQGPGPALGGRADRVPDHRGAQAGPAPQRAGQGRRDPGSAACRAAGPARGGDRRLRGHRPCRGCGPGDWSTRRSSALEGEVEAHFGRHPDAEVYLSQPGLGRGPRRPGARRVRRRPDPLRGREGPQELRRNLPDHPPVRQEDASCWPATSTTTGSSTPSSRQAFTALTASPGARAYYDQLRARGSDTNAALRQLANRLVGILHGCLKTRTPYDETTAWPDPSQEQPLPDLTSIGHGMSELRNVVNSRSSRSSRHVDDVPFNSGINERDR